MDEKIVEQSMQLILYAGTGRSMVLEAVKNLLEDNDAVKAKAAITAAGKEIGKAHEIQTALMTAECDGATVEKSILLIHAQDHLMTAITVKDLANELIEVYSRL